MTTTTWTVDNTHSSAEFEVQHLGISTYRSNFRTITGTLNLDENVDGSSLTASIEAKSIATENPGLKEKLLGEEFFWTEKHPSIEFKSTGFKKRDERHWTMTGQLTIRGVSRPIELDVMDRGTQVNPFFGKQVKSLRANGAINRGDFGLKWNAPLDTGGPYLGEQVKIELDVEMVKQG